jgi:O-antigen/teichoic acid export membrane protein
MYLLPQDSSNVSNRKIKKGTIIISSIISLTSIVISPILIPAFLPQFTDVITMIQIISIALIPMTINTLYISYFLGSERSRPVAIGSAIQLGAYLFLISTSMFFGQNVLSYSLLIATSVQTLFYFVVDKTMFQK